MRIRIAALACVSPAAVLAADIDLASRVDRVTLFPDAAQVTRVAPLDLPAGPSNLVLRGLPASLDPGSIRVEGEGGSGFAIGSVDVRLAPGDPRPALDPELDRRIRRLRDEREAVGGRIAAQDGKRAVIERYAQASPEKLAPDTKALDVGQWAAAWEAIGSGLAAVHEELRVLRARAHDLDQEIAALERARQQPARPGAPRRDVIVSVEAPAALKGRLSVTYRVVGASWLPAYDVRVTTAGKPSLELVRRAQVSQRTGEEWTDVALSVSTVRTGRGAGAPDLPPIQAQFYEPPRDLPRRSAAPPSIAAAPAAPESAETRGPVGQALREAAPVAAADVQVSVEAGAFQASYLVPGRVSVAPDGAMKSFVLTKRALNPSLLVKAVPVLDETAYLEASFVHEDEAALLPGEAVVTRDGAFVGRTRLKLTAPGDSVALGLGADDRVRVQRAPLRRREAESGWIGASRSDLREFKTTVRNLHDAPMRIVLMDRLPFSENAALTVEALRENTPPTEKQVGDKRGVQAWAYDYAPGETREIRFGYRLRWPAEKELSFEPRPVATQ